MHRCCFCFSWNFLKQNLNQNKYEIIEEDYLLKEINEITVTPNIEECTVDIKGEVLKPGIYILDCNLRVNDIVNIAGGLTDNADTTNINLAKKIFDQMVITIPKIMTEETPNETIIEPILNDATTNDNQIDTIININTASQEELESIPGIGKTKAKAIIEYRLINGPFKSIKDITLVKGIGESTYEKIKIYLTT